MPSPGAAEVLAGCKALWDASGAVGALVPGGFHAGPVPAEVLRPYTRADCVPGEPQRTSGRPYTQTFQLKLRVWSAAGQADAGLIQRAVSALFERQPSGLAVDGGNVLNVRPLPGSLDVDPDQRQAQDVVLAGGQWEITVQGERA